jgi:hypothetical protein
VHRTFLEYFCACEFVERFGKRGLEGGLTLEELKTEVFGKHWQDESWHEVLCLIVGMIDTSFAGEIIEYLITLKGKLKPLYLAAKCILEVRNRFLIYEVEAKLLSLLKELTIYNIPGKLSSQQAITVIANTWKDTPETLTWLKNLVQVNSDNTAGIKAMQIIIRGWGNQPDTLSWMKNLFSQEGQSLIKRVAIKELTRSFKDRLELLPIIKSIAYSDKHSLVRQVAMQELAQGWKDEPGMFEFLCHRALNDPFERKEDREDNPRQLALEIIIKQYHEHPQTLPFLQDRAKNDSDEKVREFVQKKLAELEK